MGSKRDHVDQVTGVGRAGNRLRGLGRGGAGRSFNTDQGREEGKRPWVSSLQMKTQAFASMDAR